MFENGDSTVVGQRFTVRGYNFSLWPDELVNSYLENTIETVSRSYAMLKLVSKTDNEMVFEVTVAHNWTSLHVFDLFGTPSEPPRTLLEYRLI